MEILAEFPAETLMGAGQRAAASPEMALLQSALRSAGVANRLAPAALNG
jgi:hypothetical protein